MKNNSIKIANSLNNTVLSFNTFFAQFSSYAQQNPQVQQNINTSLLNDINNSLTNTLNLIENNNNKYDNLLQIANNDSNNSYVVSQILNLNKHQIELSNTTFYNLFNISKTMKQLAVKNQNKANQNINNTNEEIDLEMSKFENINHSSNISQNYIIENKEIYSKFERIDLISPTILVFIIMFNAILLSTMFISSDISSNGHKREFIINRKYRYFALGHIISLFIILFLQLIFTILIFNMFMSYDLLSVIFSLIFISTIALLIFILLGIIIAYLSSSYVALLISIFTILLMIIVSDIILPIQLLNKNIMYLINSNPLVLCKQLVELIIFNSTNIYYHTNILYLLTILLIEIITLTITIKFSSRDIDN